MLDAADCALSVTRGQSEAALLAEVEIDGNLESQK
jgi:hypothetical protein